MKIITSACLLSDIPVSSSDLSGLLKSLLLQNSQMPAMSGYINMYFAPTCNTKSVE